VVKDPGERARERALFLMMGTGFRAQPGVGAGTESPVDIVGSNDATVAPAGACAIVTATGRDPQVDLTVPSASRVRIVPTSDAPAKALLLGLMTISTPIELSLAAGQPTDVVIPDIGDGATWTVRLEVPEAAGPVRLCRL
jgi:hypothetical protein